MDAIILAGGLGTRLATTVPYLPKALAPIQGIPFLQFLLTQLTQTKLLSQIILALGHKAAPIQTLLQNEPITFSIEPTPLGTGGALLFALPKTTSDTLLVLNGDTFFDLDFHAFYDFHLRNHSSITIACRYTDDASRYGTLQFDDAYRLHSFTEKTHPSGYISAGIYLIQRELLLPLPQQPCSLEHDLFPEFLQNAFAYPHSGTFIDIGTPDSYKQAQELLKPWIANC